LSITYAQINNEHAATYLRSQCLVQALNRFFVNANTRLLLVVEYQHAGALKVPVELDAADPVHLVTALK
jgi:hypothetical protein